jgi:heme exporter protein B
MKEVWALIGMQMKTEWRQRYAINGVLLHVAATVFVVQLSAKITNPPTWNAIFWILMLFSTISAIGRSFIQESRGRLLYYYGLAKPLHFILSRLIYNSIVMVFLSTACLAFYILFIGNPIQYIGMYGVIVILASVGYASVFTMISAIASKSGNSHILMPVLSFPMIIPLLLVAIKASKKAMDGLEPSLMYQDIGILIFLNVAIIALSAVLFPFLWKE